MIVWALYVGLLAGDVVITHWDEFFGRQDCNFVTARTWYQWLVTLGYRKPKPHFVRIVTVNPPPDPCDYRQLLADQVSKVGDLQPIMVVLDYSFSPHPKCVKETISLQRAIDAVAAHAPVVFGIRSQTYEDLESNKSELAKLQHEGFGPDDQVILQSDIKADGVHTISALYRLDCDSRRVPVDWPVFEEKDGKWVRAKDPISTIAFAAAAVYEPSLKDDPRLKGPDNPFTGFIEEDRFQPVDSAQVTSGDPAAQRLLRRIVVLGDAQQDPHYTVVGHVPGVVLQANYIESLLDERYFKGIGFVSGTIATLVCIGLIITIFEKTASVRVALFRSGFFLLTLMFVSYIALLHFGRLFTFWVPAVGAVIPALLDKARLTTGGPT
jgi:hypothetical protein